MVGYMREHFRCNGHKIVAILRERIAPTILAPSGATILGPQNVYFEYVH